MGEDPQKITEVIYDLIEQYPKPPKEINRGLCPEFMKDVVKRTPEANERCYQMLTEEMPPYTSEEYKKYGGHVWIFYKGKHYDAENPEGVEDWRELFTFE